MSETVNRFTNVVESDLVIDRIVTRICSTKKVRVQLDKDDIQGLKIVRKYVETIFSFINYFNSKDEYTTAIRNGDISFDNIFILNEFKDWVYPLSIRYDPSNIRTEDLLVRDTNVSLELDYDEYVRACDNFRRIYRSDINKDKVTLASLRTHKSLSEVIHQICISDVVFEEKVNKVEYTDNQVFVPIPVKDELICLFRDDYFNNTADNLLKDYINKIFFIQ